jgi:hypothetical protein
MSNSPFSIRFTPEQRKWLREYATARDLSEADALRELVDERMSDKPRDRAALISELERYDKAVTAMSDALTHAEYQVSASVTAGTAVAQNLLRDISGQGRLKAVGE